MTTAKKTNTFDNETIDITPNNKKVIEGKDFHKQINVSKNVPLEESLSLQSIADRKDLIELDNSLKNSKGYLLSVTLLTNDNRLVTHLATHKFPKLDYLPSCKKLRTLLIEELEKVNDEFGDVEVS